MSTTHPDTDDLYLRLCCIVFASLIKLIALIDVKIGFVVKRPNGLTLRKPSGLF